MFDFTHPLILSRGGTDLVQPATVSGTDFTALRDAPVAAGEIDAPCMTCGHAT